MKVYPRFKEHLPATTMELPYERAFTHGETVEIIK